MNTERSLFAELKTYLNSSVSTAEDSLQKLILIIAVIGILAGLWLMRDFIRMPFGYIPSLDEIKPRTVIGIGVMFCAIILVLQSNEIAYYIQKL
ncbi:MAG: hypothetical protein IKS98_00215 [Lachnospiraceae bacterium]|nr:hypothetical protein [Lachnospiraceae bacterium]